MARRDTLRDLALLAGWRLAWSAVVWLGGFRAVSDDDFARVVLAQTWALDPQLDPTGTSWLPLPFWLYGTAMLVGGTSLTVARVTAWLLGVASSWALYGAGRLLHADRRAALLGAAVATMLPWSIRLGVATVPELPTAALTVLGVAAVATKRAPIPGALCLLAACLSRYDPWPVAGVAALLWAYDASRERRAVPLAAAALALLGPAAWIAHNALAHGDPFHFLARVSAYKRAVGGNASLLDALLGYPLSVLREEPELCLAAAAVLGGARWLAQPVGADASPDAPRPRATPRVLLLATALLATLTLAAVPGGAPTHHAGRAVLALWLLLALYLAPAILALWPHRRGRWLLAITALTLVPLGAVVLRPWYARLDAFTPRHAAVAAGRLLPSHLAPGDRYLLEITDYRFYAVLAASGAPTRAVRDRSIDPRGEVPPSSFDDVTWLRRKVDEVQVRWVLAEDGVVPRRVLGPPVGEAGGWGLFER